MKYLLLWIIYKNVATLHKCRKGIGVIMRSSYKSSFKKLVLFEKNSIWYKITYLQKKYCRMYANIYIYIHI